MKTTYKFFLIIIFSLFFYSCEDFMDIHKQYIEDGEIIYAPKPDSIAFIGGHNRILFRCWMYNGINVKTINVSWNDGMDSLSIPVTFKTEMDSLEIMLSDMPEKSYTFHTHSVDNFGHHSLIVTNFGSSYGDIYISVSYTHLDVYKRQFLLHSYEIIGITDRTLFIQKRGTYFPCMKKN